MTFLKRFDQEFYPLLNGTPSEKKKEKYPGIFKRADAFRLIFLELEKLNLSEYNIIETGVLRKLGNWNDGQSSFLFQEFLKTHSGKLRSVDINKENCNLAISSLDSNFVTIACDDSVNFLSTTDLTDVDLFFLDSYDVQWDNCDPSAEHHLKEFLAIEKSLTPGTIIAIDDNLVLNGERTGKGRDIYNYLKLKNITPVLDEYMIIYIWS